jgi:hypothetical protein
MPILSGATQKTACAIDTTILENSTCCLLVCFFSREMRHPHLLRGPLPFHFCESWVKHPDHVGLDSEIRRLDCYVRGYHAVPCSTQRVESTQPCKPWAGELVAAKETVNGTSRQILLAVTVSGRTTLRCAPHELCRKKRDIAANPASSHSEWSNHAETLKQQRQQQPRIQNLALRHNGKIVVVPLLPLGDVLLIRLREMLVPNPSSPCSTEANRTTKRWVPPQSSYFKSNALEVTHLSILRVGHGVNNASVGATSALQVEFVFRRRKEGQLQDSQLICSLRTREEEFNRSVREFFAIRQMVGPQWCDRCISQEGNNGCFSCDHQV